MKRRSKAIQWEKTMKTTLVILGVLFVVFLIVLAISLLKKDFTSSPSNSGPFVSEGGDNKKPTIPGSSMEPPSTIIDPTAEPDVYNPNALFRLSKTGQNVIIIMLDRGMGEYLPYIMNEHTELQEQFSGFTYYSNVISFGSNTNFAISALVGGYEYTPVELNKRSEEKLVTKHNEALKVLPVLFSNNGFEVTVCDPVYANYKWTPDLSIYKDYPDIRTFRTEGQFAADGSLGFDESLYTGQTADGKSKATGINANFMESYNVLCNLSNLTQITNQPVSTYFFLANETTHNPILLQEPECVPAEVVDNTAYDEAHADRFKLNGKSLRLYNATLMAHYETNTAALKRLGEWFDFMRENDVYDNTRIIIVSDHGRGFGHFPEFIYDDGSDSLKKLDWYYPLFMVKDFNSTGFTTSDEFMTNADTAYLAVNGVIENPVNPFTNKKITNDEKYAHDQYVIISYEWKTSVNNGNTFLPAKWARVRNNIWDQSNWQFYDEETVLKQHRFPND